MDSTKKTTQKTSGTHKRKQWKIYKPGQLITVDRHVYRITKASDKPSCKHCVNYKQCPDKCKHFGCWGHVPNNCYFKLVK